ncbi:hypothetical protein [Desulfovibrio sp. ZJ369]|uniref:hypothetical protein n=1 Tax=Desulfovibrio sp. ZJ369 TaxID=2709793 RepID=UPI0013EE2425|nr:hypothetical protein [Desulfovibrio sp. ZJ369]
MGTPWLLVDKEMPTWTKRVVFRPVIHVGIGNTVPHFYLRIYPQNVWMQADGLDFGKHNWREKMKNAKALQTLAFFFVPKFGVPKGI